MKPTEERLVLGTPLIAKGMASCPLSSEELSAEEVLFCEKKLITFLSGSWSSGLFACLDDWGVCCYTALCPLCAFGETHEKAFEDTDTGCDRWGACTLMYLAGQIVPCGHVLVTAPTRKRLRFKYNIPNGRCGDFCTHFWCLPCAMCQESREIKWRAFTANLTLPVSDHAPAQNVPFER